MQATPQHAGPAHLCQLLPLSGQLSEDIALQGPHCTIQALHGCRLLQLDVLQAVRVGLQALQPLHVQHSHGLCQCF